MKKLFIGNILTLAEPLYAEALLCEDGVIAGLGDRDTLIEKAPDAEIIEFDGTLMPSFIDAHGHFTSTAAYAAQASVYGAQSADEIRDMLKGYIKERNIAPGEWIVANHYDQNLLPGYENPPLEVLDTLTPDNPLVLRHKSCHMAVFNSMALENIGITAENAADDPNIEKKNGRLTGYLLEGAHSAAMAKVPKQTLENIYSGFKETEQMYASYGITTVQDGFIGGRNLDLYDMLLSEGGGALDIIGYVGGPLAYTKLSDRLEKYKDSERIHIGGLKYLLDGSPQLRTAWVREPYLSGDCYRASKTDEAVCEAFRFAAQNKLQIIVHANGDAAIEQFLRCFERVESEYPVLRELRPTIIHAQLMGLDQIPRARALGAVVSFFVAHCYHWGDTHLRNLGNERAELISPVGSAHREGVMYTFHQDSPVIRPDMLETVWCAVNRITREGRHLSCGERIGVLDALRAVTVNAAYQYFLEDKLGTLESGKYADMVLLDRDPVTAEPMSIKDIKVEKTYKRGECIFERSQKKR